MTTAIASCCAGASRANSPASVPRSVACSEAAHDCKVEERDKVDIEHEKAKVSSWAHLRNAVRFRDRSTSCPWCCHGSDGELRTCQEKQLRLRGIGEGSQESGRSAQSFRSRFRCRGGGWQAICHALR